MMSIRREKLVETAKELFYKNGYRATGIDQILAVAGVSKPTMYKYFRSKDELIIASLKLWDREFRQNVSKNIDGNTADEGQGRLLHLFDYLKTWFENPNFNGCMSINAAVEYSAKDNPIHEVAAEQKKSFTYFLEELAREAGIPDSSKIASQFALLVDGAITNAQMSGTSRSALSAKKMATMLIDSTAKTEAA